MQDRYVGDIGDYGKYALLRRLRYASEGNQTIRLGVIWCLFPDELHNADGRHTSYLNRSVMRPLDPELFDHLKNLVVSNNRKVRAIATSRLLPSGTVFFENLTFPGQSVGGLMSVREERIMYRGAWLHAGLDATRECNLVFFDPDNGVEIASVPKGHPKAGKYVFWDELSAFWERGQSLMIYHHIGRRGTRQQQVEELAATFAERLSQVGKIVPLVYRRGSCRVFWLILNDALADPIERAVKEMLRSGWQGHFEIA